MCVIRLLFQHEDNVEHFVRLKVGFVMASGSLPAVGSALVLILIRSLLLLPGSKLDPSSKMSDGYNWRLPPYPNSPTWTPHTRSEWVSVNDLFVREGILETILRSDWGRGVSGVMDGWKRLRRASSSSTPTAFRGPFAKTRCSRKPGGGGRQCFRPSFPPRNLFIRQIHVEMQDLKYPLFRVSAE